ncbi:MAG: hypothetical protein WDO15_08660 [Bacteroidota bacterium]
MPIIRLLAGSALLIQIAGSSVSKATGSVTTVGTTGFTIAVCVAGSEPPSRRTSTLGKERRQRGDDNNRKDFAHRVEKFCDATIAVPKAWDQRKGIIKKATIRDEAVNNRDTRFWISD